MEHVKRLFAFYRLDNPFQPHDNDYWRLRLINVFLILITGVYAFFILFNLTVTHLYANATVDIIGVLTIHAIILNYRRKKQLQETSHHITISVFILSAAVIFVAEKSYGILFWSFFLPLFAMMLLGKRLGLYYSSAYYAILLTHLVANLNNGITMHVIVEFAIVSIILVAIVYYYESSRIQAYELLQQQALQDPLTTLYNRRHFDNIFAREMKRLHRAHRPFSFFLMDIDHFKPFNDLYGHQEGDVALKSVANLLSAYLRRPGDICFRLGGEEFGAITNCPQEENCDHYVEQIRLAIEGLDIVHMANGDERRLTASFGFVIVSDYEGMTPERVYKLADEALYRAKAAGRNRVETIRV